MSLVKPVEYAEASAEVRVVYDDLMAGRAKGMTDAMFMELMAVVGLANETNQLANGLRIPVDERLKP